MTHKVGDAPILVAGTGPAGMIAALALAEIGLEVSLIGPPVNETDRRTTALMAPSLKFVKQFGIMADLGDEAAPLAKMRIIDATGRLVRAPTVTFNASEIGEPCFGRNIPNLVLNKALEKAVRANSSIKWHETLVDNWMFEPEFVSVRLANGETLTSKLAIAADGRRSPAREAAGIAVRSTPWPQSALVLNFAHTRPHGSISTEFHTPSGPFTQVPLKGNRSSLVWVVQPAEAERLMALDDAQLSTRIEDRMQSMLGSVTVEAGRQVYPLSNAKPDRFAAKRIMLVGEAGHIFPPIGAQGLNLSIRDVRDLCGIVAKNRADPGSQDCLAAYDRARRPDVFARTAAVSLLNRSLLSAMLPSQLARTIGLGALGKIAPLRAVFMREGLAPGSGFSGFVMDLREQVGR